MSVFRTKFNSVKLNPNAKDKCLRFSQAFSVVLKVELYIMERMWFSDEVRIYLNRYVNKQNAELWALEIYVLLLITLYNQKEWLFDVRCLHVELLACILLPINRYCEGPDCALFVCY